MRPLATLLCTALLCGCAPQGYEMADVSLEVREEPLQVDAGPAGKYEEIDGKSVLLPYPSAFLYRAEGAGPTSGMVLAHGGSTYAQGPKAGRTELAEKVFVEFRDDRVWLSFPNEGPIPYVDRQGNLFLWSRDRVFQAIPGVSAEKKRKSLEEVLSAQDSFD